MSFKAVLSILGLGVLCSTFAFAGDGPGNNGIKYCIGYEISPDAEGINHIFQVHCSGVSELIRSESAFFPSTYEKHKAEVERQLAAKGLKVVAEVTDQRNGVTLSKWTVFSNEPLNDRQLCVVEDSDWAAQGCACTANASITADVLKKDEKSTEILKRNGYQHVFNADTYPQYGARQTELFIK
jgi:hypothetical protein